MAAPTNAITSAGLIPGTRLRQADALTRAAVDDPATLEVGMVPRCQGAGHDAAKATAQRNRTMYAPRSDLLCRLKIHLPAACVCALWPTPPDSGQLSAKSLLACCQAQGLHRRRVEMAPQPSLALEGAWRAAHATTARRRGGGAPS